MERGTETVVCEFQYSGLAAGLLAAAALATLAVIAITPGAAGLRAVTAGAVLCAAAEAIGRVALRRGRRGVRTLVVRGRAVEVRDGAGHWRTGELRDGAFVAPWLTVVRWRPPRARGDRTVVVLPGMVEREDFRRLRVALRWQPAYLAHRPQPKGDQQP